MGYRPWYPKVNAFTAQAVDEEECSMDDAPPEATGEGDLVELDPTPTEEMPRGAYIPDFQTLMKLDDTHPSISARMAWAIQADEQLRKHCFACQSPDHFIRDCPMTKNGKRPILLRGPPKNNLASAGGKVKIQPSTHTPPVLPPMSPLQKAQDH